MTGDATPFRATTDAALDKLSALLTSSNQTAGLASTIFSKATRIAADITVIESSIFTLTVAQATFPVLPGPSKLVAIGAASLAAVALAASATDIIVQLGQLKVSMGLLSNVPESDLKGVTDRLESLSDPIGAIIDRAIEFLKKAGVTGAETAGLLKEAKAFADARKKAENAATPHDKLKYNLAAVEAAKKFFEKLAPVVKEKIRGEWERDRRERLLRETEPDYPGGVDYPNQPGDQPPGFDNGDTGIA